MYKTCCFTMFLLISCHQWAQPKMFEFTYQIGTSTSNFDFLRKDFVENYSADMVLPDSHKDLYVGRASRFGLNYFRAFHKKYAIFGKFGFESVQREYILPIIDDIGSLVNVSGINYKYSKANLGVYKKIKIFDDKMRIWLGGSMTFHWFPFGVYRSTYSSDFLSKPNLSMDSELVLYYYKHFENTRNIDEKSFVSPFRFEPSFTVDYKVFKGLFMGFELNYRRQMYAMHDFQYTLSSTESNDYSYLFSQGKNGSPKPIRVDNFVYAGIKLSYSYSEIPFVQRATDKITSRLFQGQPE